jgi:hypothetical protein
VTKPHRKRDAIPAASLPVAATAVTSVIYDARAAADSAKGLPLPDWVRPVQRRWRERSRELVYFVDLTWRGYAMVANYPSLLEAVSEGVEEDPDWIARTSEAAELAALSKGQLEAGMPLLHGLAVALAWTSLETLVEELIVEILRNRPEVADREGLRELKLSLAVAVSGDPEQIARAVYDELEAKRGSAFKSGLTRFEGLFNAVGLGGTVPEDVSKIIWELGQARNVMLHRGGVVDEQFAAACPWTGLKRGDTLSVTQRRVLEYVAATAHYYTIIRTRLSTAFGPSEPAPGEVKVPGKPRSRETRGP